MMISSLYLHPEHHAAKGLVARRQIYVFFLLQILSRLGYDSAISRLHDFGIYESRDSIIIQQQHSTHDAYAYKIRKKMSNTQMIWRRAKQETDRNNTFQYFNGSDECRLVVSIDFVLRAYMRNVYYISKMCIIIVFEYYNSWRQRKFVETHQQQQQQHKLGKIETKATRKLSQQKWKE